MADAKTSGRETEIKLRVDDLAALMKIAVASGGVPAPTAVQQNAFYDTPDRALGARGLVVRVRTERAGRDTRTFVTLKGPGQRNGAVTSVLEEEVEVDAAGAAALEEGRADPLAPLLAGPVSDARRALVGAVVATLGGRPLVRVGTFVNERTRVPVELHEGDTSFHAVLELDRTHFPGDQVHHEVELEVPDDVDPAAAERALTALFRRAGVVGRPSPGKARRFFAALRGEKLDG